MGWAGCGRGLETFTECHARLQQNVRPGFEPFVECHALGLEIIPSKAVKELKFSSPFRACSGLGPSASRALGL